MGEIYVRDDQGDSMLQKLLFWCIDILMIAGIALFFVTGFTAKTSVVGSSMSPVLEAGDTVLINRFSARMEMIQRGDIILFLDADSGRESIKRVVGMPGETIRIRDGSLWVDGEKIDAEDIGYDEDRIISFGGIASDPVTLGADAYFVLADASGNSEDSRFANIGNIERSRIEGIVWARIAPLERASFIGR